jgi:hypothetical protein
MILGIDPGPFESACVWWDGEKISGFGINKNAVVSDVISSPHYPKAVVAVEHLQCFGMAVGKEVFETAYWIGHFRCQAINARRMFLPVFRSEIKMYYCNSMRAKDSNIRQALIDRFGKPGTKKAPGLTYGIHGDIWSAFAIAVMVMDKKHLTTEKKGGINK